MNEWRENDGGEVKDEGEIQVGCMSKEVQVQVQVQAAWSRWAGACPYLPHLPWLIMVVEEGASGKERSEGKKRKKNEKTGKTTNFTKSWHGCTTRDNRTLAALAFLEPENSGRPRMILTRRCAGKVLITWTREGERIVLTPSISTPRLRGQTSRSRRSEVSAEVALPERIPAWRLRVSNRNTE